VPHQQAGHMTAPDQCCINVKKLLSMRRRPHMTQSGHWAGCARAGVGAMTLKEPNASGSVRHLPHQRGAGVVGRAVQMTIGVAHNSA
jgi:hypothetical protein